MDRTHPQKTCHGYNKTHPQLETSSEKKERKTKKHIAKVSGGRNKKIWKSLPQIRKMAKNRMRWRTFVDGLYSALSDGHRKVSK